MHLSEELKFTPAELRFLARAEERADEKNRYIHTAPYLRLPHPSRLALSQIGSPDSTLMMLAEPQNQVRVRQWLQDGMCSMSILDELTKLKDARSEMFIAANFGGERIHGAHGSGTAGASLHVLRNYFGGAPHITLHDDLAKALSTDLAPLEEDVSILEKLGSNLFLEFGTQRSAVQAWLTDQESGYHHLEGAYVSKVKDSMGVMNAVEITFTSAPVDHLLNDVVRWVRIPVDRPQSVRSAVDFVYRCMNDGNADPGGEPLPAKADAEILIALSTLVQAIRLGCHHDMKMTDDSAFTEAKKKHAALQASKTLAAASLRQAETQVDRSWLTIPPLEAPCSKPTPNAKRPNRRP